MWDGAEVVFNIRSGRGISKWPTFGILHYCMLRQLTQIANSFDLNVKLYICIEPIGLVDSLKFFYVNITNKALVILFICARIIQTKSPFNANNI